MEWVDRLALSLYLILTIPIVGLEMLSGAAFTELGRMAAYLALYFGIPLWLFLRLFVWAVTGRLRSDKLG